MTTTTGLAGPPKFRCSTSICVARPWTPGNCDTRRTRTSPPVPKSVTACAALAPCNVNTVPDGTDVPTTPCDGPLTWITSINERAAALFSTAMRIPCAVVGRDGWLLTSIVTLRPLTTMPGVAEARGLAVKVTVIPLPPVPSWAARNSSNTVPPVPKSHVAEADSKTRSSPARVIRIAANVAGSSSVLSSNWNTNSRGATFSTSKRGEGAAPKTGLSKSSESWFGCTPIRSGPASN